MKHGWCSARKMIMCTSFFSDIFLMSMILCVVSTPTFGDHEWDRLALLDLKARVSNDPFEIMNSWNDSTSFCDWIGVTCNSTIGRVVALNLEARDLTGSIPHSLGNLTYLTEINFGDNKFHGPIPQEMGRLLHLRLLNLSSNSFGGEIPTNISHCMELLVLILNNNRLKGQIPNQLSTLTKLNQLECNYNNLTGTIPSWIGNFSSMFNLKLGRNNFQGNLPSELGRLSRLKFLEVYENHLTGNVPPSIYNITSLIDLTLTQNQFHGVLPPSIGFTLPNLRFFLGGINNFSGPIPTSFVNISNLRTLDISENRLTGSISHEFGRLKDLQIFNFDSNRLGSGKVGDLDFINFLANCTRLFDLGLTENHLGGTVPPTIGNLSDQMTRITLGVNMLTGSIPSGIENLINLQILGMEYNSLNGSIPQNIGKLQNLALLYLDENDLTGPIPSSIANLSSITKLYIDHNRLEGSIPPSLEQCKSLQALDLSRNNLTGSIPKEIFGLSSLSISLGLAHNSLTGPLPYEVGELVGLTELDLSENKLSGNIPINLDKCISLERLYLGSNQFAGIIPPLEALRGLQELDLSNNNLSGSIPQFLGKLLSLSYLNLSYNNFEGKVPEEGVFSNSTKIFVFGNKKLCDGLQELHLPMCMPNQTHLSNNRFLKSKVLIPIAFAIAFIGILVIIIFVYFVLKKSRKDASTNSSTTKEFLPQISYLELSKSTDRFSKDNLIGSGSFGSVYKGVLSTDEPIVAIKVLNLQQQGASKSFVDECNALSNIRHRNLLKIITSCSSIDVQGNEFKALVFNFMSNGNLDGWLHPKSQGNNQRRLSLIQRLNIAIDIACGLDYLHNYCETPIVHCDLKPNNILLDHDMVAHVGDFGLARFMLEGSNDQISFSQTMSLTLKGSIGYIPPEYGSGGRISIEGDVFSFGILLLEMIIGKRPTDNTFSNGLDIHLFTTIALPHDALGIIDPSILFEEAHQEEIKDEIQEIAIMSEEDHKERIPKWMEECLVSIMKIGLSCSVKAHGERMSMDVAVTKLQAIRNSYIKFKKVRPRSFSQV